jgi:transposase
MEDLNLKCMQGNKQLSLSWHDAGLGSFTQLLAYKVAENGCQLVVVDPAYTSQLCSRCGQLCRACLEKLSFLSDRAVTEMVIIWFYVLFTR